VSQDDDAWKPRRRWVYAAFAVGLAIFVVLFGIPTDRIGLAALATGFLSIGLLGKGWRAWGRMLLDWLPFQAVLLAYDYSRGYASPYSDEQMAAHDYPTHGVHNALGLPLQVRLPIDFDQWVMRVIGLGHTTPTQWLQEHLHPGPVDGTAIPWFAVVVSAVYSSHYLVTPVTAVVLWMRDRLEFRRWMSAVVTLAVAGLTTYVLLPTAPPWLASYQGDLDGPPVLRVTTEGFQQVGLRMVGSALTVGQHLVNPVAAMPSLHVAFATLAAAFWWSRVRRPWRWLLPVYPALMCFSLAYAGEHYLLDELAGAAYALVILSVFRFVRRRRQTHSLERSGNPSTPSEPVFTAST
jgi:membrane-associated phospholipid phosphatase